jgi:hypothetical protein
MGLNILQKKQQLEELTAKLASIQQEVYELENKNPEFTLRIRELEKSKKLILTELETPIFVPIEGFVEISCLWEGIGEWPQIIDWKFNFTEHVNKFLEIILFEEGRISLLFEMQIPEIQNLQRCLLKLDEKVNLYNKEVTMLYEESIDEGVLQFYIK